MKIRKVLGILTAAACVLALGAGAVTADSAEGTPISVCIITSSGIDDGSFNQDCYNGILAFIDEHPDCKVTDIKESDYNELIPTVEKSLASQQHLPQRAAKLRLSMACRSRPMSTMSSVS